MSRKLTAVNLYAWFCYRRDQGNHKRCLVLRRENRYVEVKFSDGATDWIPEADVFRWEEA